MRFKQLYDLAAATAQPPVLFDDLRKYVNGHHRDIGRVDVWSVEYPVPTRQAHYKLAYMDRTSAHDEAFQVAQIRYCSDLDSDPAERRYALTKELMHVFDSQEERVDSRAKFLQLINEIQNAPLPEHKSKLLASDSGARWMAVLVLCPKPIRDQLKKELSENLILPLEIAQKLVIPEWLVRFVTEDYYEQAHASLTK